MSSIDALIHKDTFVVPTRPLQIILFPFYRYRDNNHNITESFVWDRSQIVFPEPHIYDIPLDVLRRKGSMSK